MYLFGLFLSKDYGISWDENARRIGAKSHAKEFVQFFGIYHPIIDKIPAVKDNYFATDGPYGMIYEFPALLFEMINGKENTRETFLFRHKLIFTFHFIGIIAFFLFSREIFYSINKAIITTLIFSLHPRIFAHSFFNPKDIIFLSLITISLLPIAKYINTKKVCWLIWASIFIGLAMSCRIVGIYLAFLLIILFVIIYFHEHPLKIDQIYYPFKIGILIISISILTLYLATPYFWLDPIGRFIEAFNKASRFPWAGSVFFFGDSISARSIPWYYIIVWIGITTPISYLLFFLFGTIISMKQLKMNLTQKPMITFCFFGLIIPIIMAIILKSVLYDGWRHFYFVYPFICILISNGLFGLFKIITLKKKFYFELLILSIFFSGVVIDIVRMHPFQQVYFNKLAGSDPMMHFEGDYWGTSYRQGLEYLLENDTSEKIYVAVENDPGATNRHIISNLDKERLIYEYMPQWNEKPDYLITNFRTKNRVNIMRAVREKIEPYDNEFYSISLGNMKILGIYKN